MTRTSDGIVNFYIDSKLSEIGAQSSGIPVAGTTNTFIGNNEAGNKTFNGQIAELKIFSKILSADEISYLYDSTKSKYGN